MKKSQTQGGQLIGEMSCLVYPFIFNNGQTVVIESIKYVNMKAKMKYWDESLKEI